MNLEPSYRAVCMKSQAFFMSYSTSLRMWLSLRPGVDAATALCLRLGHQWPGATQAEVWTLLLPLTNHHNRKATTER